MKKYRVISDRKDYGVYETYEEANYVLKDLVFCAACYYSDEDFWIEEE